ncbi:MAG: hypothetical protein HUJ56_01700 [Erysipelotrichaceae bacterium]|nr:hypothetical protein [Erysipelotrichaceae bacterium]
MSERELAKYYPTARKNLTNTFLLDRLKGLGYIEGVHYTKGLEKTESNILVNRGILIITALQNSVADKILKDIMPEDARKEVKGKVNVWTTPINDRREFDILLSKIIGRGTKPNVFL